MGNMSYCRFENTAADLSECQDHMDLECQDLSDAELEGREEIISMCVDIATQYGAEIGREVVECDD